MTIGKYMGDALAIPRAEEEVQPEDNIPTGDSARVMEVTVGDNGERHVRFHGVQGSNVQDAIQPGTSVFTSIQSATGSPQSINRLTEDSVVGIAGLGQMRLKTALDVGVVERAPDGSYRLPGSAPQGQPQQAAPQGQPKGQPQQAAEETSEEHPDLVMEALDDATERTFTGLLKHTAPASQSAAVKEIAEGGEISTHTLYELAAQMGTSPSHVTEAIEQMRPAFEAQAMKAIGDSGVDPQAVLDWAYQNEPRKVSAAINRQFAQRNVNGFRDIAKEYVSRLDEIDPEAIIGAKFADGVTARMDKKGKVILKDAQGREVEWKSAYKAGLIKVGR